MKLAISNIAWSVEQDQIMYSLMQKYGYTGLEIAPTRIIPDDPYRHIQEATLWGKQLKEQYGFDVPSIQSIWFGRTEHIFGTASERNTLLDYTKRAIDFAAAVGSHNLVFGCPKNRYVPKEVELGEQDVTFFRKIAEYALGCGVAIGFEANPEIYQTNYVTTTQEAFELIDKVASDGFRLNLDVGTMLHNNESIAELTGKCYLLNHIHISEPMLEPIKKRSFHSELACYLRKEGYEGYLSIEMGRQSNLRILEQAMAEVKGLFG